jgi:hypothetical protein
MSKPNAEYRVKGSTIESKLAFVRERFGSGDEQALRGELRQQGLTLILDSAWYPFAVYDRLLVTIAERFYGGDLEKLVAVGQYSAERALTTTYAAYTRSGDFRRFLQRIATLHEKFYSTGGMQVTVGDNESWCEIRLSGAPVYTAADLYVAQGFYLGAARLLGLQAPKIDHTMQEDGAHFRLRWD